MHKSNRIKFLGLPKNLDVDKAIENKVNEVYGVCPYCGEEDDVDFFTVEDACIRRGCSEKFSTSDFEIEELRLDGKKPRRRSDSVFKWARMLFYCNSCGCSWGSEKYPLRVGNNQDVIQNIMEHAINGNDSPIMASIQNSLYIPPPKYIPEIPKISTAREGDYVSSKLRKNQEEIYNNSIKIICKAIRLVSGVKAVKDDISLSEYYFPTQPDGTVNYHYKVCFMKSSKISISYFSGIKTYHFSIDLHGKFYRGFVHDKDVDRFISSDDNKFYLADTGQIVMMPEPVGAVEAH